MLEVQDGAKNGRDADAVIVEERQVCLRAQLLPPPELSKAARAPRGSDEHRTKQRENAVARHAKRRARGESGRHANMVAPSFLPPPPRADTDNRRYTDRPGPTRLHDGMSNAEAIAWSRARRRTPV